jgi:carbamoyl-phosphate synthase large subunit
MSGQPDRRDGRVLVTGAGGAAGVAVIQALRGRRHVVAVDADPDAVGLALVPDTGVVPHGDDPDFAAHIAKVANRFGASALICTVAEEMESLTAGAELLAEAGLHTWLPTADTVRTCTDKWLFAQACRAAAIPAPASALGTVAGVPGPWIVKPRFGRGSRDVYAVDTVADAGFAMSRMDQPLVQTRLSGREFTVDALVDRDGTPAAAVPRWRLETKAGISTRGRTFASPTLVAAVARLLAAVGLTGPANVQGFLSERGEFCFTEVNPRFSGGLPLALAAGADLVGEYLRGVAGQPVRPERLVAQPGVTMLRHYVEVYRRCGS